MSGSEPDRVRSQREVRVGLARRLRVRRASLEEAILTRASALADTARESDAEYRAGLTATVTALVDHCLSGIELGDEWSGPIPTEAVAQARRAAHNDVSLETVLRRYVAGHTLLSDFIMQEAERGDLLNHSAALRGVQRTLAALLDRLIVTITAEYTHEAQRVEWSPEQRRAERLRRLLAEEPVELGDFGYELEAWHLGVIAKGRGGARAVARLAPELDRQLLLVSCDEETVWGWLGGRNRLDVGEFAKRGMEFAGSAGVSIAVGEPGRGVDGFRLTHRHAQDALQVALLKPRKLTRYADVALLTPWLADKGRARSLIEMYLSPLDRQRDGGETLRGTLRAYFAAAHNVKASAATLGVDRSTVRRRVRTIEEGLGCSLQTRQAELEVAMRLEGLLAPQRAARGEPSDATPIHGRRLGEIARAREASVFCGVRV
jgi:PucR C-terminal helix-turn-helix domain/GGDEF-like domain